MPRSHWPAAVVVAGAGHLTTLDQPDQVTRALVAWLRA
jgi:pimeloyl-ACP methyl ester carboxylesterase